MEKLIEVCIKVFIVVAGGLVGRMFWRMRQGKQRKRKDIPPNANMMYEDDARLYFGCGVMAVTPFLILGVIILAKLDTGDTWAEIIREGGIYFILLVCLVIVILLFPVLVFEIKDKQCIFWNQEGVWVDSLFHKRKYVQYGYIQKIVCYRNPSWTKAEGMIAYGFEGEKLFYAMEGMYGYQEFYETIRKKKWSVMEEAGM